MHSIASDFFKLFPFLVNDYVYITLITFLYWFGNVKMKHNALKLAFIVPFSTILCALIKNLIAIPRPPAEFHMVPIIEPFGFPSADVEVATVFWFLLASTCKGYRPKILAGVVVLLIAISRIYLKVHNIPDVIGGFLLGTMTVAIMQSPYIEEIFTKLERTHVMTLWIAGLLLVIIYFATKKHDIHPPAVLASLGAMGGFGLFIGSSLHKEFSTRVKPLLGILGIISVLSVVKYLSVDKTTLATMYSGAIFKYGVIALIILFVIPKVHNQIAYRK